jgi:hypothetical protein
MIMVRILKSTAVVFLICIWTTVSAAEGTAARAVNDDQVNGLDEQVQDLKNDVLGISTEISRLEEKLLYPANTQVSIFLLVTRGEKFRLDAVKLKIDGKEIANYIYTSKEMEALQNGGVQRIYTGNIRTGEHALEVESFGKSSTNIDYEQNVNYPFTKEAGTKFIEINLAGPGFGNKGVTFRN